jgi:hypothetical protein
MEEPESTLKKINFKGGLTGRSSSNKVSVTNQIALDNKVQMQFGTNA